MTNNFSEWKDRIAWGAVICIVVGGSSWAGWVTTNLNQHVSANEVADIVQNSAPYLRERELILSKLDSTERTEERLARVIEQNTKAITTIDKTLVRLTTQAEAAQRRRDAGPGT